MLPNAYTYSSKAEIKDIKQQRKKKNLKFWAYDQRCDCQSVQKGCKGVTSYNAKSNYFYVTNN